MKIATWNVNSIRARAGLVEAFLDAEAPDVIALQETKCATAAFPGQILESRGYAWTHSADDSGSRNRGRLGVALASRSELTQVSHGFGGQPSAPFDEPRLVAATIDGVRVITLYAPNGKRRKAPEWMVKLAWFELLRVELELELDEHRDLVVLGDFNICPTLDDVYAPDKKRNRNLVSGEERAALRAVLDLGLVDVARALHGPDADYTWFAQQRGQFAANRGYRLDLVLASESLAERATRCQALLEWRRPERSPSDHAPVVAEIA